MTYSRVKNLVVNKYFSNMKNEITSNEIDV